MHGIIATNFPIRKRLPDPASEERWAFNLPSTTPPNWREIDESMAIERFRPEEPAPWRSSYTGASGGGALGESGRRLAELPRQGDCRWVLRAAQGDRKSTRLNSKQ